MNLKAGRDITYVLEKVRILHTPPNAALELSKAALSSMIIEDYI